MTILQQPDSLSLSGNIKEFRIQTTDTIFFVLFQGEEEIVSRSYEPGADGIVIVDVHDIVHARLSFQFSNTSLVYEQTSIVSTFKAVISGTEVLFTAIRCGIDMFADTAMNFLTQNFLTWQPNIKPVTYYSPEFLTYYATQDCNAKLRAYFTNGEGEVISQSDLELAGFSKNKAYTIPLQYASVFEKLGKMPAYYDVFVENPKGERLTYIQRYYASDIKSETEQWILFENSLGGIDTFRAYGTTTFTGEHTHNVAEINETSVEYRVDTARKYQKNTGFLDKKERTWLLDFFPSLKKYLYIESYLRPIIVVESNASYTDKELPSNYTFTYKYADAKPLLNLSRTEIPTGQLNITVPALGSFTVPPRLVEFPRLPLSEGVLLPVQEPYSEVWNATTAGSLSDFVAERLAKNYGGGGGVGHHHGNIDLLNLLGYTAEYLLLAGKKVKAGYADQAYSFLNNIAQENIKFAKGAVTDLLSSEKYDAGEDGHGYRLKCDPATGESMLEVDKLHVRIRAEFKELLIESLQHIGGELVISPARIQCTRVEELDDNYRCYFDAGNQNNQGIYDVDQAFTVGALGRCEVFSGAKQKYYWRLVSYVGENYIGLSKTECAEGSDLPEPGDVIAQFGHATDSDLMNVQVISSVGPDAPCFKQYVGINSFVLPEPESVLRPGNNKLTGVLRIKNGSTGAGNLSDLPEEVAKAVDLGSVNILQNSGFTGQYDSEVLSEDTELEEGSELYCKKLKDWTGIASVQEDDVAVSGFAVTLGSLSQSVKLIPNENYVVSYKAKGENVAVSCGDYSVSQELTADYERYIHKFKCIGNSVFLISGTAILCDLKLERGTVVTDWTPSPLDSDKSLSELQSLQYLSDSIKNGSVDILGGLVMANMLQLGNYSNGKLQKLTAGVSGIYNDDDDIAFWAGGSLEQAIKAAMLYKDNPNYRLTDEELKSIAKVVLTHGGRAILNDVILRGTVYAENGIFNGEIKSKKGSIGGWNIEEDAIFSEETEVVGTYFSGRNITRMDKKGTIESLLFKLGFGEGYIKSSITGRNTMEWGKDMLSFNTICSKPFVTTGGIQLAGSRTIDPRFILNREFYASGNITVEHITTQDRVGEYSYFALPNTLDMDGVTFLVRVDPYYGFSQNSWKCNPIYLVYGATGVPIDYGCTVDNVRLGQFLSSDGNSLGTTYPVQRGGMVRLTAVARVRHDTTHSGADSKMIQWYVNV
jgi:hypothetical protein